MNPPSQNENNLANIFRSNNKRRFELVNLLLACPCMSDPSGRQSVVNQLSPILKHQINYAPISNSVQDVSNLVQSLLNFSSGLEELLEIIRHFNPGTIQLEALESFLLQFAPIVDPTNFLHDQEVAYINFCDNLLAKLKEETDRNPVSYSYGVFRSSLKSAVSSPQEYTFWQIAFLDLEGLNLVRAKDNNEIYLLTDNGKNHLKDKFATWENIARVELDEREQDLLLLINRMSVTRTGLEILEVATLAEQLNWPSAANWIIPITRQLHSKFLIGALVYAQGAKVRATYKGLIWEADYRRRHSAAVTA